MNGAITADSVGDERFGDHPSDGELYDFFASRGTELDLKKRQRIAIHVTLCRPCASTGEFIEETEEHLDAQLTIPPSEEDHAGLQKSLAMVRLLTTSRDWPGEPENPPQHTTQWILVSVKDFFYSQCSTLTGRLQLIAGSFLAAIALSVLGYGLYNSGGSTISSDKWPAEQLPNPLNPSPSQEIAQASPPPTETPSSGSQSAGVTVKTDQPPRLPNATHADQLLAHLNPVVDLNRSREALYRGGGIKPKFHPTIHALSDGPTKIRIRLPDGSINGLYSVTIEDPYFKSVAPPAMGESPDGKDLTVSLRLAGLAPSQRYYLGIARQGGAPMHYQVRLEVTRNSPSQPEPRSPR